MPFLATIPGAILGGAVLAGGATAYASNRAAKATERGTQQALDTQWQMYQQQRQDFAPWRQAGEAGLAEAQREILDPASSKFNPLMEPGYRFGFKEFVEDPYMGRQSATGKRLSGETYKGLTRYAQDYASTAYDNFLNRYYNLANYGVGASAQSAGAAGQYGANAANLQYSNALNQGNYQTQMAAGLAGIGQNAAQSYMNYNILDKLNIGGQPIGGLSGSGIASAPQQTLYGNTLSMYPNGYGFK